MNTQNNNLIAATVIGVVTIIAVVVVSIMRPNDGIIITILVGAGGAMVTQFLAVKQIQSNVEANIERVAVEAKAQVTEVHDSVNGKMEKLLEATGAARFAEGKEVGVQNQKNEEESKVSSDIPPRA